MATGLGIGVWRASECRFGTGACGYDDGMTVYGFRFYSPGQGRFLNRDQINEPGSILGRKGRFIDWEIEFDLDEEGNLYAFVRNDTVNAIDYQMVDPDGCSADLFQWLCIVGDKDRPFPEVWITQ